MNMSKLTLPSLILLAACVCLHGLSARPPARIDRFAGEYRFLSNFYPATVIYEGLTYPDVEHAYQSAKTLDMSQRRRIAALPTPAEA